MGNVILKAAEDTRLWEMDCSGILPAGVNVDSAALTVDPADVNAPIPDTPTPSAQTFTFSLPGGSPNQVYRVTALVTGDDGEIYQAEALFRVKPNPSNST